MSREGRVSIPIWVFSLLRPPIPFGSDNTVRRFNPDLGFLPASTFGVSLPARFSWRFNPDLGFLPASTGRTQRARTSTAPCFNPDLGFLPASTDERCEAVAIGCPFQSRSGFSPCFDVPDRRRVRRTRDVSIPIWVFSLLRQLGIFRRPRIRHCFNPDLGFLPASTVLGTSSAASSTRFNPDLGFLPASTSDDSAIDHDFDEFQSRSGFSPCFDPIFAFSVLIVLIVSIPIWVFSLLRPAGRSAARGHGPFQSRSGFSPCFDRLVDIGRTLRKAFQSRSGFSPCFDRG